jgi:DNA-3-methyladenine glycosylase II
LAAFPPPAALLEVSEFPGLPPFKLRRLHAVADAALDGRLDTAALRDLEPAEAMVRARELDGIGPFYAELMAVRALGHTDVLPVAEPLVRSCLAALLGQAEPISVAEFAGRAEAWRPWRTWASVFLRAVGPRCSPSGPGGTSQVCKLLGVTAA